MKKKLIGELELCLDLWEKKGSCTFGGYTVCRQCAAPYLLLKQINGEILHGDMVRLTLYDWKRKLDEIKK